MINPHEIQFDFEAEIRIYREDEGGRKTPASNGIRWDFGYAQDDLIDRIWAIYPWFLLENGEFMDLDVELPTDTLLTAKMYVLDDSLRTEFHQTKARIDTQFFCHEGPRKMAEGHITKILDLHKERPKSEPDGELRFRDLRASERKTFFGGCHLMTCKDQSDGVIQLHDGRFQLISGGKIGPIIVCHDVILARNDIAAILNEAASEFVVISPVVIFRRSQHENFTTHSRLTIARKITWKQCQLGNVDWPPIALLGADQIFVQPSLSRTLLEAGFDCLDFEPNPLYCG